MEPTRTASKIRDILERELNPSHLEIVDHSARHVGHPGADSGGGHFEIVVVSEQFDGLSRLAAQRLVYQALGELMAHEIHALSMRTFSSVQWRAQPAG